MIQRNPPYAACSAPIVRLGRSTSILLAVPFAISILTGCHTARHSAAGNGDAHSDWLRRIERERLKALVDSDSIVIDQLHAPDFEVINPLGNVQSRIQYIGSVLNGVTDYLTWDIESPITVRDAGPRAAILRYRTSVTMTVRGTRLPPIHAWNTSYYERTGADGSWRAVWFQVTEIR